ncbi:MAG: carboxymuconolactone decarboxylase family protein [Lyngbya sp. HA4199-MV5]|jgi:4-carboxymuconolactone decarboxylase|nr:carboxymuconolactone decarboxylase family protein [Lyngbya sp. HA4199-MV5]
MQTFQQFQQREAQYTEAQNRRTRGWNALRDIDGKAGEKDIGSLKDIASNPRSSLALRSREIATIATLTALGNAQPELKMHIHRALDLGCTRTEVVAVILQVAVWVGFAAVLHSTTAAKEVFQERDARTHELNHA